MPRQRFRDSGKVSFSGYLVYDRMVPQDHFLRRLNEPVDWEGTSRKLFRYYMGGASYGPSPYEPGMLLKMLLVSYLRNLSERQVEELANDTLSVKCFPELAVDDKAPEHSILIVFKQRLLQGGRGGGMRSYFKGLQGGRGRTRLTLGSCRWWIALIPKPTWTWRSKIGGGVVRLVSVEMDARHRSW